MAVTADVKRNRPSRSGSEKRRRSAQVSVRMLDEHRDVLERVARERGYRSPAELMLEQCKPLFAAAGVPISA